MRRIKLNEGDAKQNTFKGIEMNTAESKKIRISHLGPGHGGSCL